MSETITITEFKQLDAKQKQSFCIKAKVLMVEAPKEGISAKGRKWKRQSVSLGDQTGEMKLGLFNRDIGKLLVDKTYEICELDLDTHMNHNVANVSYTTTIKEITITNNDFLKQKQDEIKSQEEPTTNDKLFEFTKTAFTRLQGIENSLKKLDPTLQHQSNGQRLGLLIKEINNEWIQRDMKQ